MGPQNKISEYIQAEKHRLSGESFETSMLRQARALSDNSSHEHLLKDALLDQRILFGGRIQAGVGSDRKVTLMNCVMSGDIADSLVHGENCIADMWKEAASVLRMGAGIGYNFSTLRPREAPIVTLESTSTGAVSFMEPFDAICHTIHLAGHRRGAQMGILRVDHPDIEEFVHAKINEHKLTNFNISVGITDEFMHAMLKDRDFDLRFNGKVYRTVRARDLWKKIMDNTWDWAEPGVLFLDTMERYNPLSYAEQLTGTNPCSEIPLPPYGCCCLASINLARYIRKDRTFNYNLLIGDVYILVSAMDNVIDVSLYPLDKNKDEMQAKRRIGIGVTGLANALEAMGYSYGDDGFISEQEEIMGKIQDTAWKASIELAKRKGPFPLFDAERYTNSEFAYSRIPLNILYDIKKYGLRNSHLTAVAPTGTISLCANNVSSGIEPVYSHMVRRKVKMGETIEVELEDYGLKYFGVKGKTANEVTLKEHMDVLRTASMFVDQSVSKTVNIGDNITRDEFENVYYMAWRDQIKGCATYRAAGKRSGILEPVEDLNNKNNPACYITDDGQKICE